MKLAPLSDSELQRFHDGDPRYFRALIHRYGAAVRSVAISFARDDDELKDLCQDVWLRVFLKRTSYQGSGPLLAWILTLARRTCISDSRRTKTRESTHEQLALWEDEAWHRSLPTPLEHTERRDEHARMLRAVLRLTDRQRMAVLMRLYYGYDARETAELMECKQATVRGLVRHGLMNLRKYLEVAE